ncbi:hypothetical protein CR513_13169, partial [Mucuna pruriens]
MGTKYQLGAKIGYLVQIRTLDLHAIRSISNCLKEQWRKIETQPEALKALVQYYDAPARCFTFRDFQMAPTLEEYECLLGLPLTELGSVKKNRNGSEGLPRAYLEKRLDLFRVWENWSVFMDALELLIYEILLFPQLEDYVDLVAMGLFLAKKNKGENSAMVVLADTYYSLNQCGERGGPEMLYAPFVFMANVPPLPMQAPHYLPDRGLQMELDSTHDQGRMDEASEKSICWYPPWNEREHIIVKCEGYPNVPLLGTQGAINYNPELAVRQAGYPIITPPPKEALTPFVLPSPEALKGVHYRKIRRAWSNLIKNGTTEKLQSCGASPEYRQWVEERVKTETLEVERLKVSLDKTKAERAHWKRKLEEALEEIHKEKHLNVEITKKARAEHDARFRIGSCLKAADKEMCAKRAERDQVTIEKERLERTLLDSQRREDEHRE